MVGRESPGLLPVMNDDVFTEMVHSRARAHSRQTMRVASNEVGSWCPQLMGATSFILPNDNF
jgi:hypothetical protein